MSTVPRTGRRLGTAAVRFRFDGRDYDGIDGDTAAAALLANGVRLLGRSVKYRRPRGLLTAGWDEPSALLTLDPAGRGVPNLPASVLPIAAGRELASQNRWPNLQYDLTSCLGLGGHLLGAGFYYKTFIWPSWRTYEGSIRRLAGLGPAPRAGIAAAPGISGAPLPRVEHARCDVLVVGGGPAGLAAALAASAGGAQVMLCEREPVCGGELEFEDATIEDSAAHTWVAAALAKLAADGARVLTNTAVIARSGELVYSHGVADGQTAAQSWRIAARELVIATGASERPIAFVDNDRPGVMLLGAAESLLARYGVRVAQRAVLFGNHDRLYAAATRLRAGGVQIAAVVDVRPREAAGTQAATLREALLAAGVECLARHAVIAAHGRLGVRAAQIAGLDGKDVSRRIDCDAILMSGGWTATGLRSELHGHDATDHGRTIADALAAGHAAGIAAAGAAGRALNAATHAAASGDPPPNLQPFARSPCDRGGEKRQFVDFQNDVTVADLRQALAEGFCEIEHVKRYTTLGVGTDQGRIGGALGAAILAELCGKEASASYTSRTRAPLQPATLAVLAGRHRGAALRPARTTALHEWHVANGAEMESMGMWLRPRFYRANGADAAIAGAVEAARVRSRGGLLDGSTLGKIDIAGPGAAEFVDRLYLTRGSTIREGRARYMVLLREDGMVLDDGLVLRLAHDRFLATTSSGHANHMLSHFEYWRDVEFASRGVSLADVTEAWAVVVVAGPVSPGALTLVLGPEWISSLAGLTHMDHRSGAWQGRELRVLRASFSGELAYELHCRPRVARALWEALLATGLEPYGIEALDVLRVEKGYLTTAEMNGQVTPLDLGLEPYLAKNPGCIGADLLDRPAFREPQRPRLVGLQAVDANAPFIAGAQLTVDAKASRPCGYVTSSCASPALGRHVALALVSRELAEGAELVARDPLRGHETRVRVTSPVHFDTAGIRMKGR